MGQRKLLEKKTMKHICELLQSLNFHAKIIDDEFMIGNHSEYKNRTKSARFYESPSDQNIVELQLANVGDRGDKQLVQISFLPASEEFIEATGFNTLQMVCCIHDNLPTGTSNDLVRVILKLNPKIVSGSFNISERDASFIFRSCVVVTDNMEEEIAFSLIQVHLGIFLSDLDKYNDVLMDVIEGLRTADEAFKKGII